MARHGQRGARRGVVAGRDEAQCTLARQPRAKQLPCGGAVAVGLRHRRELQQQSQSILFTCLE